MKEDYAETPFVSGMYRGFARKDLVSPELLEFLHDPDRAFSDPASTIIKDSNTTSSCTVGREHRSLHIKRYNYQNTFYALKYFFRTSRAKRVWKVAQHLIACNIPTPQPISFLDQRKGGLLIKSFFISKTTAHKILWRSIYSTMFPDSMRITITTGQNKVNGPYRLSVIGFWLPLVVTGSHGSKMTAIRSFSRKT